MATISGLNYLINHAKDSGVVDWEGDLKSILDRISLLIKERGLLYYEDAADLVGVSNSESQFALVKDTGLYQYVYSASTPTVPYENADIANYYWVMVANYKELPLSLSSLLDVNITNPIIGQVIGYNDSNGKWENYDIIPTRILTPLNGQTLEYSTDYAKFVNKSVNIIYGGATAAIDLVEGNDTLVLQDASVNYIITLPLTFKGKTFTIAYDVAPSTGDATIKYDGSTIYQINGTQSYSEAVFNVTLQFDSDNNQYVPISSY